MAAGQSPVKPGKTSLTAVYLNLGIALGPGVKTSGNIGADFLLSNDLGGAITLQGFSITARNLPRDYQAGHIFGWVTAPRDQVELITIALVKNFPFKDNKRVRAAVEGGFSLVRHGVTKFVPRNNSCFLFGCTGNYDESLDWSSSVGLALKAKLGFPFATVIGLELSAFANINPLHSLGGIGLDLSLGKVRPRIKPKKTRGKK